jgi:prepilin-type N-terminal cleavage/methylation domain-containing protein
MAKRGFTLVELVLVVSIIGLCLFFAVKSFSQTNEKIILKSQAEGIIALLESARQTAQTKNENIEVVFDYDSCRLETADTVLKIVKLQDGFTAERITLGFTPAGTPAYAGTVYLQYQGRQKAKIILAPASGILRWEKV